MRLKSRPAYRQFLYEFTPPVVALNLRDMFPSHGFQKSAECQKAAEELSFHSHLIKSVRSWSQNARVIVGSDLLIHV